MPLFGTTLLVWFVFGGTLLLLFLMLGLAFSGEGLILVFVFFYYTFFYSGLSGKEAFFELIMVICLSRMVRISTAVYIYLSSFMY